MKKRMGFVSNSSSSSFIVIGTGELEKLDPVDVLDIPSTLGGTTEFGWGPETLCDLPSRINFSVLQAIDLIGVNRDRLLEKVNKNLGKQPGLELEMISMVLINNGLGTSDIDFNVQDQGRYSTEWGYIDHQSSACEGENIEMFESIDALERFIFAKDSEIVLDNDNH